MQRLSIAFCILLFASATLAAESKRTWEGKWNNKKYGTSGPLKCVANEVSPGKWEAKFTGTFQGDPFEYKAKFDSKPGKSDSAVLSGKATIRGHRYQWKGSLKGGTLIGDYNSSVGYHGRFQMRETSK